MLELLDAAGVEFIVVGGVAAFAQGAPLVTIDLDIVPKRDEENVRRLTGVLGTLGAFARGRPGLVPGPEALKGLGHQLLQSTLGDLDILGCIEDDLDFDALLPFTKTIRFRGCTVRLLSLEKLVELKRRSTREKDRARLPVLEAALRRTKA
jgi:hypothetical protein